MSEEVNSESLRVCCECNKWLPVQASDAGRAIKCPCGRRVEVPLLEEFRDSPDLVSATSVEERIKRLIAWGELPRTGVCEQCGDRNIEDVVLALLDCESSSVHYHGGGQFIWIPFLFWAYWQEEEKVEIRGRDTCVPAPICLCKPCQAALRTRPKSMYILSAIVVCLLGVLVGYFILFAGIALLLVGLIAIMVRKVREKKAQERALKELIGHVPVYRQILASFPYAGVILPPE